MHPEASAAPFGRPETVRQLAGYLEDHRSLGVLVTSDEVGPGAFALLAEHVRRGDHLLALSANALIALIDAQLALRQGRAPLGALAGLEAIEQAQWARVRVNR